MGIKTIVSRAPTRIDLAGGTVDIWPIFLFLQQPVTINLGIDLYAEARVDLAAGDGVVLRSEDQNKELKISWKDLRDGNLQPPPQLELHYKLLRYFAALAPTRGGSLTLSTRAKSPSGAGLGGSSTLSIAMIGALATWAREGQVVDPVREGEKFIEIVRDVETTVIQVPAGMQDYYGAMFGGLQAIRWGAGSHTREWLPGEILGELEDRLLLFYSGQSRNSGINNWALFKAFIDKQENVREKFARIVAATQRLETALRRQEWATVGAAIAEEWETRRTLAPGITTKEIDHAFAEAQKITPISGKICGAGGGGCFFVYLHEDDRAKRAELKAKIARAFEAQGIRPLPFKAMPRGLDVQVTRG